MTKSIASQGIDDDSERWARYTLIAIAIALFARVALLAAELSPLHFDEAQYWTYGEALDWGYYSKPPMIAWIIRLGSEIFGATPFGVRIFSPLLHSFIAWMIFAIGRRLFDARAGFWAALAYLTLPGVTVGASLMTTDTPMMAAWAIGLYALARITEPALDGDGGRLGWWALFGAAIGLGLLSKYTVIALAGGALGFALFSRERGAGGLKTALPGIGVALVSALLVWSPNLWWNAQNGFASILHVADNAKLGGGPAYSIGKAGEFFIAQLGVFNPILFAALVAMVFSASWRREQPYRLLFWVSAPLLLAMIVQAFLSRAHPNWAAPAYIGFTIVVAAWLLDRSRAVWLKAATGLGIAVFAGYFGLGLYLKSHHTELPRIVDMFKKTRPGPALCEKALPLREGRPLFGVDRRLLADCMFAGGLGLDDIRILTLGRPGNHYQLAAPLRADDTQDLLLVHLGPRVWIEGVLGGFSAVEILDEGEIRTHANRAEAYLIAVVSGGSSMAGAQSGGRR